MNYEDIQINLNRRNTIQITSLYIKLSASEY